MVSLLRRRALMVRASSSGETTLDTIVHEGKSYRDIFITAGQIHGFDFENGFPSGCTINAGSPSVSTDDCYSLTHSLKCFGSGSQQTRSNNTTGVADWNRYSGNTYFAAFKAKCDRYTRGWLGINQAFYVPNITSVTDGWVTSHSYLANAGGQSNSICYIGSGSSANLDGYLDDIVVINLTDLFTNVPSEADILQWYNEYCDLRKQGQS